MPPYKRVFISHSSQDKAAADELTRELEKRGLTCWIAPRDIPPGQDFSDAIVLGIDSSDAMVVLVSSAALDSPHVRSEVARAASNSMPIYPVRLVDIEILGGLQFFLELSQWIDFFPNPTTESYDALAAAISSGKSATGPRYRTSVNTFKLALTLVAGVAAVLVAVFVGQEVYFSYQERILEEQAQEDMRRIEGERAQREAERAASELDAMTVSASLVPDVDGLYLTRAFIVGASARTGDLHLEISVNEDPWERIDPQNPRTRLDLEDQPDNSLRFRILDLEGNELKVIDSSDLLRQTLERAQEQLSRTFERIAEDSLSTCDMSHCYFRYNRVPFCDATIETVSLEQGDTRFTVPDAFCQREDIGDDFCIPAQDVPFDLVPGETFDLVFDLRFGGTERVTRTIVDRMRVGYASRYTRLPAQVSQPDAPVLVASYTPSDVTVGGFRFVVGWGACNLVSTFSPAGSRTDADGDAGLSLMVDIDGRGMVAVDGPNGALSNTFSSYFERGDAVGLSHRNTPLRLPAGTQTIEVGFAGATGLLYGPWSYEFDPAVVVADTAVTGNVPVVACSGDRLVPRVASSAMQRQTLCLALQPTDFFDVASVAFGGAPGQFTEEIEISFTADAYLDSACDAFNGPCPPFRFEVPEDWTNIYSRITMRDGRLLQPTRHQFQR